MRTIQKTCTTLLLLLVLTVPLGAADGRHAAIDVVICLDVSGSMQDLLDGVRIRIWDVVAELSRLLRPLGGIEGGELLRPLGGIEGGELLRPLGGIEGGELLRPLGGIEGGELQPDLELRVGVLAYGTAALTAEEGWMWVPTDLTHDLDHVFSALMDLEVGGDEELVARAVATAVETMSWSPYPDALKILFVAGNEPVYEGRDGERQLAEALALAEKNQVIVNALYAGSRDQAVADNWPDVARGGRGNFSAIDARFSRLQVATPQDAVLLELNDRLNMTYVPYGRRGSAGFANQAAQDINATRFGVESCSSRIVAKGSALYNNASWDLVDASLAEDFRWSDLRDADLPEELRGLATAERVAYVARKRAEREEIQRAIQEVSAEREAYLRAAPARGGPRTGIDDALLEAIRAQAVAAGLLPDC